MPNPSPAPGRPAASRNRSRSPDQGDQTALAAASDQPRRASSTRTGQPGSAAERNELRWRDIKWVDFTIDDSKAEYPIDPPPSPETNPAPATAAKDDGFGRVLRRFGQTAHGSARTAIPGLAPRFARMPVPRSRPEVLPQSRPGEREERFAAPIPTSDGIKPEPRPSRSSLTRTLGAQLNQVNTALRRRRESLSTGVGARLERARAMLRPRSLTPSPPPGGELDRAPEAIAPPRQATPSPALALARRIYAAALRLAGNDPERLRRWLSVAGSAIAVAAIAYAIGAIVAGLAGSDTRRHTMSDQPAPSIKLVTPPATPPSPPAPPPAAATPPSEPVGRAAFYLARAKAGDPAAQYDIGVLYAQGSGLVQDYASAASWFHAAAAQGNLDAEYNLGVFYERGLGVAASPIDAVNWYRSAADQNHPRAQYNLAIAYAEGRGTEQDFAAAARWYQRAARQGLVPAMVNLAILYERGQGVDRSPVDAYAWYSAAAERGDNPARDRAGELLRQFTEPDRAKAQGLAATVAAAINGAPPA